MKFIIEKNSSYKNRQLIYVPSDYSFITEPTTHNGYSSFCINYLQLEMDCYGEIFEVWGLCSHLSWVKDDFLTPSNFKTGSIRVDNPEAFTPGIGISLLEGEVPILANPKSGWIRMGDQVDDGAIVEIFNGVLIQINNKGEFKCLWLKPVKFPLLQPYSKLHSWWH